MKRWLHWLRGAWCHAAHSERALVKEGCGYRCTECMVWIAAPWASELERIRAEQRQAVEHVQAGEGYGAVLGATDWMAEELALLGESICRR